MKLFLFSTLFAIPALARDFRPQVILENIPAANSSVQQCCVFQTTPGIRYTVEISPNLSDWTVDHEFYGIGHQHVVTLREYTPAPPPPPGTPPASPTVPSILASIKMQPASGAAGGTVVSWASLDHGGPVIVRIAGEMVSGWNAVPLYYNRYAPYDFYVWHPGDPITPPAMNPVLHTRDGAMITMLEASLPAMNQEVIDSAARARNAPDPPPADPDAKRFLRVKLDHGIDTDSDGSPDWAEFEIAARGTGMMVPGVIGNAFDADTNADGIRDGDQLDADLDGTADSKDVDSTDNTTVIPLGDYPRYAMFEIPGNAIQINDLGTVIFPWKTWKGGVLSDLLGGGAEAPLASARGINDLDVILGTVARGPDENYNSLYLHGKICYWPNPPAPYQTLQVTEEGQAVQAYVHHDGVRSRGPASILSSSGHFIAHGYAEGAPFEYVDKYNWYPTLWQLPTGAAPANRTGSAAGALYLSSTDLMWGGSALQDPELPGKVHAPSLPLLPFYPLNVISHPIPSGGTAIFATSDDNFGVHPTQVFENGQWRDSAIYADAIDIAADGTAVGRTMPDMVAPILLNGKWHDIRRTTPGLPETWHDGQVKLTDTTSRGWVLATNFPETKSAALLPIRAEGFFVKEFNPGEVSTKYAGVDNFSIGSSTPGDAVQDRIWIMAPLGGPAKAVTFTTPVHTNHPLIFSALGIDFGNVGAKGYLHQSPSVLNINATAAATSGTDVPVRLYFQDQETPPSEFESLSRPLGVKVMKARVVKITLYKVTKQTAGMPDNTADQTPPAEKVEAYLNDIFKPQVNVSFEVAYAEAPLSVDWDVNLLPNDARTGNGELNCGLTFPSIEQDNILSIRPAERPVSNIDVFLIGTEKYIDGKDWGVALRIDENVTSNAQVNACWVVGDSLGGRSIGKLMQTIAHEIGHIIVGYGHPDSGNGGSAPLPGTNHSERLLVSGGGFSDLRGSLLVKKEWDKAELWLLNEEANNRMDP